MEGTAKAKGRPPKKPRIRPNSGRKTADTESASLSTMYRRAHKIADNPNYDLKMVETAASIKKRRSNEVVTTNEAENEELNASNLIKHTKESALAFYLEGNLTRNNYELISQDCRGRNAAIYPGYDAVLTAKKSCEVECEHSEVEVVVPMQRILNKTVERLYSAVASDWSGPQILELDMHVTVGFDGSSSHLNPQQKYADNNNLNMQSNNSLLGTSFTILMLQDVQKGGFEYVNPVPHSVRSCRPLRISIEKETEETIKQEYNRLATEINNLQRYKMRVSNGQFIKVNYVVTLTLFDQKCVNTITDNTSTVRCPMCRKTSSEFGNLNDSFTPIEEHLHLGLGSLHCLLRTFEYLLHLAYRLEEKEWYCRGEVQVNIQRKKEEILENLRIALHVRADQVLPGFGTSNTGNLARVCFRNHQKFAQAIGVDEELVERLAIILAAFRTKTAIDLDRLEKYCSDTYVYIFEIYPWIVMSPTLHKLLKHGCQVARKFSLSQGHYSEDAIEAWHKYYRKIMVEKARQDSRDHRLLDTFNRAVYLSDPLISSVYMDKRIQETEEQNMIDNQLLKRLFSSE